METQVIRVKVLDNGNVESTWKTQRCRSYDKEYTIRTLKKRIVNLYGSGVPVEVVMEADDVYIPPSQREGEEMDPTQVTGRPSSVRVQEPINKRFEYVQQVVEMVIDKEIPSAIFTGDPGLGKTYTVLDTLSKRGLRDLSTEQVAGDDGIVRKDNCFIFRKGYSTAKGLYRTLYDYNGMVIVFDDCDQVHQDKIGANILKGALDSYAKRVICWTAEARSKEEEESLPRSFEFNGQAIFISNMRQEKIDQALISRSMCIDLSMTRDEKIERMEFIAQSDSFLPQYDDDVKLDAIAMVKEHAGHVRELSLRTLVAVCKVRYSARNWKELASYILNQ